MKKFISVILSLITIFSVCALSFSAFAADKVTYQTTYRASETNFSNSYGTVYSNGNRIMSEYNKKVYLIDSVDKTIEATSDYPVHFYLRGNTIYYEMKGTYYSAALDGSNKKTIKKISGSTLMGGYGKKLVIYNNKDEFFYFLGTDGKTQKLFSLPYSCPMDLFGGKIYYRYNNEICLNTFDLEKKTNTRKALIFGSSYLFSKKYLYYVSSANLMRMDVNGKKVKLEANVKTLFSATDGSTILFSKTNPKDAIYKKNGTDAAVKVTTETAVINGLKKIYPKPFDSEYPLYLGLKGAFAASGKVFFVVEHWANEDPEKLVLAYDTKTKKFEKFSESGADELMIKTNGKNIYMNGYNDGNRRFYKNYNLDVDYPFVEDKKSDPVTSVKDGKVTVSWTKLDKVSGYRIYRTTYDKNMKASKLEMVGSVKGASTVKFTDTTSKSGTKYVYFIRPYKTIDSVQYEYSGRAYRTLLVSA